MNAPFLTRLAACLLSLSISLGTRSAVADAAAIAPHAPEAQDQNAPVVKETKERDTTLATANEEHDAWRLGALAGVGFPRPLALEGMLKIEDWAAFGLEYGVLPKTSLAGVDVKLGALSGDVRVFPFRGMFFVGARVGRQWAQVSATLRVANVLSTTQSIDMEQWFINPRLGILWTSRPGFTLGTEVGVQIPLSAKSSSTLPSAVASAASLDSMAKTFGETVLPTIDLVRVGWLF